MRVLVYGFSGDWASNMTVYEIILKMLAHLICLFRGAVSPSCHSECSVRIDCLLKFPLGKFFLFRDFFFILCGPFF